MIAGHSALVSTLAAVIARVSDKVMGVSLGLNCSWQLQIADVCKGVVAILS